MRVLHHYQLSASRFIRLVLAERGLVFCQKLKFVSIMKFLSLTQLETLYWWPKMICRIWRHCDC